MDDLSKSAIAVSTVEVLDELGQMINRATGSKENGISPTIALCAVTIRADNSYELCFKGSMSKALAIGAIEDLKFSVYSAISAASAQEQFSAMLESSCIADKDKN